MKNFNSVLYLLLFSLATSNPFFANDSLQFQLLWEQLTFPELPQTIVVDKLDRPYFYLAHKNGGFKVYQVTNWENPELIQSIGINAFDGLHVMNASQQGNFLYLALGNFFGSNQQKAGIGIIDLSDPESISVTDFWTTDTIVQGSAIAIADGNYAYLGAMNQGLMIFDISDKSNISLVSQYIPDRHFPTENPNDIQEPNARGMAIHDDLLYLCYDAGGIRVIDLSDKANPTEVGRYINEDMLHKAQAYNNIVLNGDLAYVAVDYCGLEILDISNPSEIERIGWWNPWECDAITNLWLYNDGHTNQLAFLEDEKRVYLSAGASELSVVDVSNPELPESCGGFGEVPNQQAVWGLESYQNKVLLTYINAVIPFIGTWSGIKIIEAINPINHSSNLDKASTPISNLSVYPNPFKDNISISFSVQEASDLTFTLIDLNGKILFESQRSHQLGAHQFELGSPQILQSLIAGVYLLKISSHNYEIYKKLVKTK